VLPVPVSRLLPLSSRSSNPASNPRLLVVLGSISRLLVLNSLLLVTASSCYAAAGKLLLSDAVFLISVEVQALSSALHYKIEL
jgi:hypothetical protein